MVWERNNDSCTESIELLCCGNKDTLRVLRSLKGNRDI